MLHRSLLVMLRGSLGAGKKAHAKARLGVLTGVITALLLAGCQAEPLGQDGKEAEKAGDFELSLLGVQNCESKGNAEERGRYELGVHVELRNLSAQKLPANFYYARLLDAEERERPANFGSCRPYLAGPPLLPDQRTRGWLNFQVDEALTGLSIVYVPSVGQTRKRSDPLAIGR